MPVTGFLMPTCEFYKRIWLGLDSKIAAFQNNAWACHGPLEGWLCWVADGDKLPVWDSANWVEVADGGSGYVSLIGVDATVDAVNRLSVSSDNSLLSHDGSDHRVKVNKASATDTASLLFQDGYEGRAEVGLAGG